MASAQSLQRLIGWRVSMQARAMRARAVANMGTEEWLCAGRQGRVEIRDGPWGIARYGGAFDLWLGEIAYMKGNLRSSISFYFKSGLSGLL
jgi:hypothetical protein